MVTMNARTREALASFMAHRLLAALTGTHRRTLDLGDLVLEVDGTLDRVPPPLRRGLAGDSDGQDWDDGPTIDGSLTVLVRSPSAGSWRAAVTPPTSMAEVMERFHDGLGPARPEDELPITVEQQFALIDLGLQPPNRGTPGWVACAEDLDQVPLIAEWIVDALVDVLGIDPERLGEALSGWPVRG